MRTPPSMSPILIPTQGSYVGNGTMLEEQPNVFLPFQVSEFLCSSSSISSLVQNGLAQDIAYLYEILYCIHFIIISYTTAYVTVPKVLCQPAPEVICQTVHEHQMDIFSKFYSLPLLNISCPSVYIVTCQAHPGLVKRSSVRSFFFKFWQFVTRLVQGGITLLMRMFFVAFQQ